MSGLVISAEDLFDGQSWRGPATVLVEEGLITAVREGNRAGDSDIWGASILPGLIDWGVSAVGYVESPLNPNPFAPEAAFAAMCLRFGVTTVVDLNNTAAGLAYLASLTGRGKGPRIISAGGRLSTNPGSRQDVLVDAECVGRVIAAQHAAGASLISLGEVQDRDLLDAVLKQCRSLSLPVVISRQRPCETPGFLIAPVATLSACDQLPSVDDDDVTGAFLAPQLEAVACWTVDGLMKATDAAMAAPFLPYARNFARSEGFIGRRIGRSILGHYYGDRDPGAIAGRDRPASVALASRSCLASSGVGGAGLVPGRSLWAELKRLDAVGASPSDVLFSATGVSDDVLGHAQIGRIAPGYHADMLVFDVPTRSMPPGLLWEGLSHVVTAGQPTAVDTMTKEVDAMIVDAMTAQQ